MGEIIPALLAEGLQPRVMLEYSGTLLHGLRIMGADDVIDGLKRITRAPGQRRAVGRSWWPRPRRARAACATFWAGGARTRSW
jgi:hypothetical protein